MNKKIVNLETGETVVRELTPEELAKREAVEIELEARAKEDAEKEAQKQSAKNKLAALGLTPEEIAAITGA